MTPAPTVSTTRLANAIRAVVALFAVLIPATVRAVDENPSDQAFREGQSLFRAAEEHHESNPSERAMIARRYRAAAARFLASCENGGATTAAYTNAGNAFWFAGDVGEAVLAYRRALALDPGNERARSALDGIRETLPIQRQARSDAGSLADALFFWHDERYASIRRWAVFILFPAAWLLFMIQLARRRAPWLRWVLLPVLPFTLVAELLAYLFRLRRAYVIVGTLCLIVSLAALGSMAWEAFGSGARPGVVLVVARGRNGNGERYQPSHERSFPPGTEVEVRGEREAADGESWSDVALLDGSTSWVPTRTLELVRGD